jgi:hypothetical protein
MTLPGKVTPDAGGLTVPENEMLTEPAAASMASIPARTDDNKVDRSNAGALFLIQSL